MRWYTRVVTSVDASIGTSSGVVTCHKHVDTKLTLPVSSCTPRSTSGNTFHAMVYTGGNLCRCLHWDFLRGCDLSLTCRHKINIISLFMYPSEHLRTNSMRWYTRVVTSVDASIVTSSGVVTCHKHVYTKLTSLVSSCTPRST